MKRPAKSNRNYRGINEYEDSSSQILPKYKVFCINLTQFGINFMVILLSVIVMPAQVEKLVKNTHKGRTLGGLVAAGAIFTLLSCPLVGMKSDRLSWGMGRRRPMILIASVFLCIGLLGMAMSAPEIGLSGNPMQKVGSLGIDNHTKLAVVDTSIGPEIKCEVDLVARRCRPYLTKSADKSRPKGPTYKTGNMAAPAQGVVLPRYSENQPEETKKAGSLGLYVIFYIMVVLSQSTIVIPLMALLADLTHPSQRGINSGIMGAMILLGNVSGATAGISFSHLGVRLMYAIIILINVVCVLITTFSAPEKPLDINTLPPCQGFKTILMGYWEPLKDHDFRWVFITRLFMQLGVSTITGFLEYWIHDVIPLPNCWSASTAVSLLLLPLLFAAAMSSLVFGIVSDTTGRRKIIVAVAAAFMGVGSFVNAFIAGSYAFFIAAVISFLIGLGFGAFLSVDFALLMDILQDKAGTAKDIALWHQSLVLPQAIAAPLGGAILDGFQRLNCGMALGYVMLFIVGSIYFLLSALFVFKIRRAR